MYKILLQWLTFAALGWLPDARGNFLTDKLRIYSNVTHESFRKAKNIINNSFQV